MAKCKVKCEWKGWKRGGYAEVMNSGAVQALLKKKADAAAPARFAVIILSVAEEVFPAPVLVL